MCICKLHKHNLLEKCSVPVYFCYNLITRNGNKEKKLNLRKKNQNKLIIRLA